MPQKQKEITLPSGQKIPAFCLGAWYLGERASRFSKDVGLVRDAFEAGCRVFNTAESYGDGGAQEVVGEALADCRKDAFVIAKTSPENHTYEALVESCEKTLERLKTDYIDLFLMHWCSDMLDLREMYEAFRDLRAKGLIRGFGGANFDDEELDAWVRIAAPEERGVCQTFYNLFHHGSHGRLMRLCRKNKIPVMTYFPYESDSFVFKNRTLKKMAQELGATPQQVALAWSYAHKNNAVIYKARRKKDVQEALGAMNLTLSPQHEALLNTTFPLLN